MPRTCSICTHPERHAIDKALVAGEAFRNIAQRFGTSTGALHRHKAEHLPRLLARARRDEDRHAEALVAQQGDQEARDEAAAVDVMAELRHCLARVRKVYDACDEWLTDPADPSRYTLAPRAEEVQVVYTESGADGTPRRRKAPLSELLARLEGGGAHAVGWEVRHADPRDLVLRTDRRLQGQLELIAKLLGELDERPQINVLLTPEWARVRGVLVEALAPFPEARAAAAAALVAAEAGHAAG